MGASPPFFITYVREVIYFMDIERNDDTLMTLTADIVASHVSNNSVAVGDIPQLIANVHGALANLTGHRLRLKFGPSLRYPSACRSSPTTSSASKTAND